MTAYAAIADLRQYLPQVPENGQQIVTIAGATGGTFVLGYEGTNTSALAWNATATVVQTALRAIPAIGSSGVNVRGRPGAPYTVSFQGTLASDAAPLTSDGALLTPASTITIAPATDTVLQSCLDRATDIVRGAMRSLLADETFDYAAYGVASTRIVRGFDSSYLRLPAYQSGTVTLVEYQSSSNPRAYTAIDSAQWEVLSDGRIYRSYGWGGGVAGDDPRYRVTATWGYGPTPPPAIVELTLELAVNIWRTRDSGGYTDVIGVEGSGAIRQVAGLNRQQAMVLENMRDHLLVIGV